jgi:predicted AAA+ superfamily ATPase
MSTIEQKIYKERFFDLHFEEVLRQLPALLVVGPRTIGKTTTLARRAKTVVRLDDELQAGAFLAGPDAALKAQPEPVLLDEWQHAPGILGAVKRSVDQNSSPNRFYVTGSVQAEISNQTWPGTGRMTRVAMYPMTVREQVGRASGMTFFDKIASGEELVPAKDSPDLLGYIELALQSGFPEAALKLEGQARLAWLEGYIGDLLTHDIEQIEESSTRGRDQQRLRRYFESYAVNSAGVLDHKTIYDAAEINRKTAVAYERLLDDLLIVNSLPAWATNRLKRIVHNPKRYLIDASLIAAVLRLDERGVLADSDLLGRIIDTFVVAQLRPEVGHSKTRPRLFHLRTQEGRKEIDVIAELAGNQVIGIEIKAGGAPDRSDAAHLRWLRDELGDRFVRGVVLHTGPHTWEIDNKIIAVPISVLWGGD